MLPAIAGGLVAGGMNLIGDIVSQTNARSAFQSRYQDTVKDMRAAGLNPALAYGQGGGNPQTSDFGDTGTSIMQGAHNAAQARLTTAQAGLLEAQTQDLKDITHARALEQMQKPDYQRWKNISAEARSIMDMITQRQREATNASDITARLNRNDQARIQRELSDLSIPQAKALANYFRGPIGRNEGNIDKILDVIRAIRSGAGNKSFTTNNYMRGGR